jgi:DNA (cytosine-5)-methyltransferase 1
MNPPIVVSPQPNTRLDDLTALYEDAKRDAAAAAERNVLSLFSGIGGLDLGLERAGFRTVGQVEFNPFCQQILAKHWPEVPRHDDVRTAPDWWLGEPRPRVDVIAGGPPCQGHSVAGKQRGTADERWGWPWFRDVVEAVVPPYLLIENVPNLTRTGLVDILRDLADLGFDAWWGRVPAAAVGAPHLRWRLFLLGTRANGGTEPGWTWGTDGPVTTVTGYDGARWTLADAGSERLAQRPERHSESGTGIEAPQRHDSGGRGDALANACRETGRSAQGLPITRGGSLPTGIRSIELRRRSCSPHKYQWAPEPDVGRVAHGVPSRVDRLKALGNAVVPAVGEYAGHLLRALIEQQARGSVDDAA